MVSTRIVRPFILTFPKCPSCIPVNLEMWDKKTHGFNETTPFHLLLML